MRVYKGVIEHGIELCFKYSLFITVMMGEVDQEDRDEMKDISDMIDCIHFGGSHRKNIETVHYSEWISYRLIILCITIACL